MLNLHFVKKGIHKLIVPVIDYSDLLVPYIELAFDVPPVVVTPEPLHTSSIFHFSTS